LTADLRGVIDENSYATLLTDATTVAAGVYRIVLTLPDGTVVVDTAKTNNTFANFQAKAINENHNSRIAIQVAQQYQCGFGLETKFSSSTGLSESYFALRLGDHLDSAGTARISRAQ
jgi:hypothetical protein